MEDHQLYKFPRTRHIYDTGGGATRDDLVRPERPFFDSLHLSALNELHRVETRGTNVAIVLGY